MSVCLREGLSYGNNPLQRTSDSVRTCQMDVSSSPLLLLLLLLFQDSTDNPAVSSPRDRQLSRCVCVCDVGLHDCRLYLIRTRKRFAVNTTPSLNCLLSWKGDDHSTRSVFAQYGNLTLLTGYW